MSWIAAGAALVLLGGLSAILARRNGRLADGLFGVLSVSGCAAELVAAIRALTGPPPAAWTITPRLPGGAWQMGLDGLSAWFLLVLASAGGLATIFGVTYLRSERGHRPVAMAHATWALLLAAMIGVLTSRSALPFLLTWEAMAVGAYLLIMFEHEHEEVRRAGLLYLVLTHLGTLALIAMFLAWGRMAGGLDFTDFVAASGRLPGSGAGVLLLALFGFGVKAGAFPLHFWLPGAHAAAPSHVSALLSGVMLKIGIYGLLRIVTLVGTPPAWWGWTVLLLGLASAVLGVLWALAQHDLKRLLAYSSVENIGIILMGMGLGALGSAYRQPGVALLGYAGALLHTLNHALFKSLLFLGAGAVVRATGTREIDRLGGLARRMPRTALLFLVGSVAIVGLPPLNGFVSEWLVFSGLLAAGLTPSDLRVASVATVGLALTGALALACFAKVFGIVFLGRPRSGGWPDARETAGMLLPQWMLAACCIGIGLAPGFVIPAVSRVVATLMGPGSRGASPLTPGDPFLLSMVSAGALLLGSLVWLAARRTLVGLPRGSAATWSCGFAAATARMQYTASSSAAPLLAVFGPLSGSRFERVAGGFRTESLDPILDMLGRPAWKRIRHAAMELRVLQSGGIRWYLLYTIVCLLALLVYLRYLAPR